MSICGLASYQILFRKLSRYCSTAHQNLKLLLTSLRSLTPWWFLCHSICFFFSLNAFSIFALSYVSWKFTVFIHCFLINTFQVEIYILDFRISHNIFDHFSPVFPSLFLKCLFVKFWTHWTDPQFSYLFCLFISLIPTKFL